MNRQKQFLLMGLLLLAGLAVPGALGGVIQLSSGEYTVLEWKNTSAQGGLASANVYLNDALNLQDGYEGASYYSAGRGNECGMVIALQAPAGEHLGYVNITVSSNVASWQPSAYAYGAYKAGPASTLSPDTDGTNAVWKFAGDTKWFSNNAINGSTNSTTLNFTGLDYDYVYFSFFLNNAETYNWQGFRLFNSAADGSNPGLVIKIVPEPASLGLLALGGLALLRRRRN